MKKTYILFFLIFFASLLSCHYNEKKVNDIAEVLLLPKTTNEKCNCPKDNMSGTSEGDKPIKTYNFSNGRVILMCGGYTEDEIIYSEFILLDCYKRTKIDFWDATFNGTISFKNDTLVIKEIKNLPTGSKRSFVSTVWSIEKLYFSEAELKRDFTPNRNIKTYSKAEITKTLNEFKNISTNNSEANEELMYRLFMCAISGNETAKKNFNEFPEKLDVLDGAFLEEYKELKAMLRIWGD
ncbi:hypothetical protein GWA97_00265 [Flavobacterium sp. LaA7.5]|nr:hypothetical protein [Flavobacterium salilacus subsp. altitudinum]